MPYQRFPNPMTVLFLCTGNSCRSQMAEGWLRYLSAGKVTVLSAGIEAHGKNPRAIAVMKEAGIDISTQESTKLNPAMIDQAHMIITVCGHADEHCPPLPANIKKIHWPLSDPARAEGSEETVMAIFRKTRDDIRQRVVDLLGDG